MFLIVAPIHNPFVGNHSDAFAFITSIVLYTI